MPYESTISSYIWYLLAIPNDDFHVPSQKPSNSFPFVPVEAHGAVEVIDIFHAKDVLLVDKVLTSQIYEAEAGLENAQF